MKTDTHVCDTCHKAIDIPVNPTGITALPRCKITKNCAGTLNSVSSIAVADGQYQASVTADTWFQRPLIYDHTQTAPRRVWTINHGLGASAIIQVVVHNAFGKLVPLHDFEVVSATDTTSVIQFAGPETGVALCTARQTSSAPQATVVVETATIPLSIDSTMVIAVAANALPPLGKELTVELSVQPNPLRPSDIVTLEATDVSPTPNPWAGATYVVVANKRYFLRYVDITDVLVFHRAAANYFVNLFNNKPVVRGDAFVLISDDPFEHASDRNLGTVVDLADLAISKQSNTLLTKDALLCTTDALSTVYPKMKVP